MDKTFESSGHKIYILLLWGWVNFYVPVACFPPQKWFLLAAVRGGSWPTASLAEPHSPILCRHCKEINVISNSTVRFPPPSCTNKLINDNEEKNNN